MAAMISSDDSTLAELVSQAPPHSTGQRGKGKRQSNDKGKEGKNHGKGKERLEGQRGKSKRQAIDLGQVIDKAQSEMYEEALLKEREALLKERQTREEAEQANSVIEHKLKEQETKTREANQRSHESHVQEGHAWAIAHEQTQRAEVARIVHESEQRKAEARMADFEQRTHLAETKAERLDLERRRLELDLAEAETTLMRIQKNNKDDPSSSMPPASETIIHDGAHGKTHKQKQNERRRAMAKHKQDRICDVEM